MGWTPPRRRLRARVRCRYSHEGGAHGEVATIGLDIAKSVFQAHAADASGAVVFRTLLKGAAPGSPLARILAREPRMLVAVALADKTARIVWAPLAKGEIYRAPALAA